MVKVTGDEIVCGIDKKGKTNCVIGSGKVPGSKELNNLLSVTFADPIRVNEISFNNHGLLVFSKLKGDGFTCEERKVPAGKVLICSKKKRGNR